MSEDREPFGESDRDAGVAMARAAMGEAPAPDLRARVLAFGDAPQGPVDPADYEWTEILPGVRVHVLQEDQTQDLRKVLIWAAPGAVYPDHRHLGPEEILVLQGRLRDKHGEYGPGDILRSDTDSVHSEEALPGEDCICFVVYRGGHEMLP